MTETFRGRIIKGVGGLYSVLEEGKKSAAEALPCRARGVFRQKNLSPEVGDLVLFAEEERDGVKREGVICEILERKNLLIRPPVANLDRLFVVLSVTTPVTVPLTADKLIASAEHYMAEPVIVISKTSLDPSEAARMREIYENAGFTVFVTDSRENSGIELLREFITGSPVGLSAFAGASGAGKSTLINSLFPGMSLLTGDVSRKTGRGRHTTRAVELYPLSDLGYPDAEGFLADTPGFSALDFLNFDFFELPELPSNFREFAPYLGECRYRKCTHLCEDGCAVCRAVEEGRISKSRHDSYRAIYAELKQRHPWEKKS